MDWYCSQKTKTPCPYYVCALLYIIIQDTWQTGEGSVQCETVYIQPSKHDPGWWGYFGSLFVLLKLMRLTAIKAWLTSISATDMMQCHGLLQWTLSIPFFTGYPLFIHLPLLMAWITFTLFFSFINGNMSAVKGYYNNTFFPPECDVEYLAYWKDYCFF